MMTGLIPEKEFSRKTFLKGGGALIVGLSTLSGGVAGNASAAGNAPNVSPDATQVDTWLAINGDGSVTMYPPKMDFGQGTWTGFKQIVAEELDVSVDRVLIPIWDSGSAHPFTNNPASTTVGSNGTAMVVRRCGRRLRRRGRRCSGSPLRSSVFRSRT